MRRVYWKRSPSDAEEGSSTDGLPSVALNCSFGWSRTAMEGTILRFHSAFGWFRAKEVRCGSE